MKSRKDVCYEEATSNPIFLFQRKLVRHWDTERVFFSREEGEQYGKDNAYNYRKGWRVYCIPCDGVLAKVLNLFAAQIALLPESAQRDPHQLFSDLAKFDDLIRAAQAWAAAYAAHGAAVGNNQPETVTGPLWIALVRCNLELYNTVVR